jgi:hypothetical protein
MSLETFDRTSENNDRDDFWTVNAAEAYTLGQVIEQARLRVVAARDAAAGLRSVRGEAIRQVLNDALDGLDNVLDALLTAPDVHGWQPSAEQELRLVKRGAR